MNQLFGLSPLNKLFDVVVINIGVVELMVVVVSLYSCCLIIIGILSFCEVLRRIQCGQYRSRKR